MSFTIVCDECENKVSLNNGKNSRATSIEITGEPEALCDAEVYIVCSCCKNSIDLKPKSFNKE